MTAPCQEACPAGNNIPRFVYEALKGNYRDALATILKESPFPGVCGRVCFHPCEVHCNRGQYDEAVSIPALERYVFDATAAEKDWLSPAPNPRPRNIAVVGAGPSGLSCAYFLALLGHRVTVFEAMKEAGGLMAYGIPEYRLPKEVVKREIGRIAHLGVEIRTGARIGVDIPFDHLTAHDAVFLSPGAGISANLDIPGEEHTNVLKGLDFLRHTNAKPSKVKGREVLVIGGGNTAMDVARSALRLGAQVIVAYRRTRAEMPAFGEEIDDAEEEGTVLQFLVRPVRVDRLANERLAVTFQRMQLGAADASGRAAAVPVEGTDFTMETDYLITATGESVDPLSAPSGVVKSDLIRVDRFLRTDKPGMFAGGDVIDQPRTIVTAIGAGKKAAVSIDLHLKGLLPEEVFSRLGVGLKGSISFEAYSVGRKGEMEHAGEEVVSYDKLNTLYFEHSERVERKKRRAKVARKDFREVNLGLSEDEAKISAARCFACGTCNYCYNCYFFCPEGVIRLDVAKGTKYVDYGHCKGCGTCAKSCPRSVVVMKELQ